MIRLLATLIFSLITIPAWAENDQSTPFPTHAEYPDLTINAAGQTYQLDHDALRALPASEFTTTTIWTDGPQVFRGIAMTEILNRLSVTSGTVKLTAANGYQIDVPVAHYFETPALLAYDRNDRAMTLRDKGPLWIVYPFDSDPAFQSELIYANSIWQLETMDFADGS